MSHVQSVIDRYFAAWNEPDPSRRRALIAQTWTADGNYLDPFMAGDGPDGIDTMIKGVQDQFPGYVMRRTGEIDAHHDRVRFTWELATESGLPMAGGLDVGIVADGRLRSITGFIDFAPSPHGD